MPRIYYCTAEEIEPIYDAAAELVMAKRRKKAERLLKKEDRLLSVGASLMLRSVLKINSDEEMLYNEHGKPYLEHGPCFSISHSGNTAVLVVSENEIGADIEKLRTPDIRIAKRSFSEEEAELAMLSPENFTRLWTRKEAVLKLLGAGFSVSPKNIDLGLEKKKYELFGIKFGFFETEIEQMPFSAAFCGEDSEFMVEQLSKEELLKI